MKIKAQLTHAEDIRGHFCRISLSSRKYNWRISGTVRPEEGEDFRKMTDEEIMKGAINDVFHSASASDEHRLKNQALMEAHAKLETELAEFKDDWAKQQVRDNANAAYQKRMLDQARAERDTAIMELQYVRGQTPVLVPSPAREAIDRLFSDEAERAARRMGKRLSPSQEPIEFPYAEFDEEPTEPLSIESGKFCRDRTGRIHGPMVLSNGDADCTYRWTSNRPHKTGRWSDTGEDGDVPGEIGEPSDGDLIGDVLFRF